MAHIARIVTRYVCRRVHATGDREIRSILATIATVFLDSRPDARAAVSPTTRDAAPLAAGRVRGGTGG